MGWANHPFRWFNHPQMAGVGVVQQPLMANEVVWGSQTISFSQRGGSARPPQLPVKR